MLSVVYPRKCPLLFLLLTNNLKELFDSNITLKVLAHSVKINIVVNDIVDANMLQMVTGLISGGKNLSI